MKFSIILIAVMLGGCMTLSRHTPPKAELIAPAGTQVIDQKGNLLRTWSDGPNLYFSPKYGQDNYVNLEYRGDTTRAYLSKHVYPWIAVDVLSFGTGFFLDDLTNKWYDYNAVNVAYDTSLHSALSATSTNWLGEPSGGWRPSLLLLGDINCAPTKWGGINCDPSSWAEYYFEWGAGIDFGKRFEVFYSDKVNTTQDGHTPWVISGRWFFANNFFAQASAGGLNTSYDTVIWYPDLPGIIPQQVVPIYGPEIPILGAGIGWAGDYSFLILQTFSSTQRSWKSSTGPGELGYYRTVSIGYGIYLRF